MHFGAVVGSGLVWHALRIDGNLDAQVVTDLDDDAEPADVGLAGRIADGRPDKGFRVICQGCIDNRHWADELHHCA